MENKNKVEGIGGWLIIPIIGFITSFIIVLLELIEVTQLYYLDSIIHIIIINVAIMSIIAITLYKIFKKRHDAVGWAVATLITTGILNFLNGIYFGIISSIIWIIYFYKSKRVRNTFVK